MTHAHDHIFVRDTPITIEDLCPHCFSTECECELPQYFEVKDNPINQQEQAR
jgi:hypothetical protein